jgi:hypothetical protein
MVGYGVCRELDLLCREVLSRASIAPKPNSVVALAPFDDGFATAIADESR